MSYNDALNSVSMVNSGMKSRVAAREDIEFQYRIGGINGGEYHRLMDSIGTPVAERRCGEKAYGINREGIPFYTKGTGRMY